MALTSGHQQALAVGSGHTVLQYKQDVISAVEQEQYDAALNVLAQALQLCPDDPLLLDFQSTLQAKLQQGGPAEGAAESSDNDSEESDDSDAADGSTDGSHSDGDGASSSSELSDSEGSEDAVDHSSAKMSAITADHAQTGIQNDAAEAAELSSSAEEYRRESRSAGALVPGVAAIRLDANSFKLKPQDRAQMKQQLAAAADKEQSEALEQKIMQDNPLLAAL